jgi:hypothetical protein
MTSRRMQFGVLLAVCACLFLPACRKGGGEGGGQLAHLTVTLSVDGNGNCVQKLNGAPAGVVSLSGGDTVTFQTDNNAAFALQFPPPNASSCYSPFRDASGNCQWSFNNSNPTSGAATGPQNTTYNYGSLSIGGAACNLNGGPQPLGMRMK